MSLFEQIGENAPPPLAEWGPPIAGLLASACAATLTLRFLFLYTSALPTLLIWAAGCVGFTLVLTGFITRAAFSVSPRKAGPEGLGAAVRFASLGIWFVPVALVIAQGHIWSLTAAAALFTATAKLLQWYRYAVIQNAADVVEVPVPEKNLFSMQNRTAAPVRGVALIAAGAGQMGIILAVVGRISSAAFFVSLAAFLIAWGTISATDRPRRAVSPSKSRIGVNAFAATVLTVSALLPQFGQMGAAMQTTNPGSGNQATPAASNLHSGAILLSEIPRHLKIIAPPRRTARKGFSHGAAISPLTIPFTGEYWFSSFPVGRPKSPLLERGSPLQFKFTAMGEAHLWMQAHQALQTPIDIRCCSRVELSISNADPFPQTVSAEVILVHHAIMDHAPSKPVRQSLGEMDVMSTAPFPLRERTLPVRETLAFSIPASSVLQQFEEITVLFHLRLPRMQRSANIAVNSFVLVPRGF